MQGAVPWTCSNLTMKEELPSIRVIEIKENDDDTCTIDFETSDSFDKMYLEETGKKRVTKRGLSNFIRDLLMKAYNKEDGYDIRSS